MSLPNFSLENKVAIVTGGGTGIGKAIALTFAEAGANVVVASRKLANLEKVVEEVRALGKRSLAVRTDITRKSDVNNLVRTVIGNFGVIDILVNNAGIGGWESLLKLDEDSWGRVIDTNLKGCYLCCQAVGETMVDRKKGNIINISSTSGVMARLSEGSSSYDIAKAGVIMLTKGLARDLGRYNIRVNAIAPGWTETEMIRQWSTPEMLKEAKANIALGRIAQPTEIASVALFLACEASSYVTGHTIIADGGELA